MTLRQVAAHLKLLSYLIVKLCDGSDFYSRPIHFEAVTVAHGKWTPCMILKASHVLQSANMHLISISRVQKYSTFPLVDGYHSSDMTVI